MHRRASIYLKNHDMSSLLLKNMVTQLFVEAVLQEIAITISDLPSRLTCRPFVEYVEATWSLTFREEERLRISFREREKSCSQEYSNLQKLKRQGRTESFVTINII